MRKTWNFEVKGHSIRITNSWLHGMKLYVDGDRRDEDYSVFALGNTIMLSARLGQTGVIEVEPKAILTTEIDVYLKENDIRILVFSSSKRLPLSQQRYSSFRVRIAKVERDYGI